MKKLSVFLILTAGAASAHPAGLHLHAETGASWLTVAAGLATIAAAALVARVRVRA